MRTIDEVIGLEDAGAAVVEETHEFVSGGDWTPVQTTPMSDVVNTKNGFKKRRGRPPKFQVSEVGVDGRKYYACTVCNERYEDRMELMQHMRQHNKERPFHCKDCGKAFKQAAHLKVHERQHTGEKPFECTICGKGFRQKAIVDQHMRTHTQLRPYGCTYPNCDKSFAQKTSLDNHTKSHQTGRLSEAFKKQQEEQRKKSLLAQEVLKNSKPVKTKTVQHKSSQPSSASSSSSKSVKPGTTVIKMTQAQFEKYLEKQQELRNSVVPLNTSMIRSVPGSTSVITNKPRPGTAATGPFLAYVNQHKPVLQSQRPELSLLEVLKELASRWNNMSKTEKHKFNTLDTKNTAVKTPSQQQQQQQRSGVKHLNTVTGRIETVRRGSLETEECEPDAGHSIAGAVFQVGESAAQVFQVQEETAGYLQSDKSLNQNVFGKRVVVLNKEMVDKQTRLSNGDKLEAVTNLDSDLVPVTEFSSSSVMMQFDDQSDKNSAIIFDPSHDTGADLEINNTIFYLPNIVEEGETLETMS